MDESGKVRGIRSGEKEAIAPLVICDPSYCADRFKKATGKVIRAICLLNHPIPNTHDAPSIQIILPAKQLNKKTGKLNFCFILFRHLHFYGELQSPYLCQGNLRRHYFSHCWDRKPWVRDTTGRKPAWWYFGDVRKCVQRVRAHQRRPCQQPVGDIILRRNQPLWNSERRDSSDLLENCGRETRLEHRANWWGRRILRWSNNHILNFIS